MCVMSCPYKIARNKKWTLEWSLFIIQVDSIFHVPKMTMQLYRKHGQLRFSIYMSRQQQQQCVEE